MPTRHAACSCGQLHLTIDGEPARVSMCHCLECQRRTGAVISNQARFTPDQIAYHGKDAAWQRDRR
jgi:hypothetical protein